MRRSLLLPIACVVAVFVAGGITWRHLSSFASTKQQVPHREVPPPIPATLGAAERKNVPVFLDGLGTVQAYNTVTVNTRVDGTLDKVSFVEGQKVQAGDILAQIDPRPFKASLDLAIATKAKDEAQLVNARLDLKRFQQSGTLATTQQQIDTQEALVNQLVATVQGDQANIEAAQVQLDYTTIRAPISGRTGIRLVDQGNIVHAANTTGLVVITQLQPISVIFTLPQDEVQNVIHEMEASRVPLMAVAQGRDDRRTLDTGTLSLVDNQIDPTSGNVRLKATFPNAEYALWPGQFVNVRLQLKTLDNVVTVPSTAVQRGPDGMFVYTVKPDTSIAIQPVNVAQMSQGVSVIDKGISVGTPIVVAGQFRLKPGSRVQSVPGTAEAGGK
ncbi:efflux RND transporter periplasmic adaptor subunit [Pseudolabrys sp. Root1462]|uniref:efflux RND transporter periplasmic adaptor subunit n=1 Tax=Pseudolabrys sp. Root1462 TaxID=1736466 RepID=UPI0009E9EF3B|nr:efflux RND transporter periplasmic adaptor subunit [Pseudolabrys sp. Root1462]